MNFIYTLAFIKQGNKILMINRNKQPWQGMWNGVGGKINQNETPLECVVREIYEETNLKFNKDEVIYKGKVTWNNAFYPNGKGIDYNEGLYLYFVNLNEDILYETPILTDEGILAWKDISFLKDKDNLGIAYNIPYFIDNLLNNQNEYEYRCLFEGNNLKKVAIRKII